MMNTFKIKVQLHGMKKSLFHIKWITKGECQMVWLVCQAVENVKYQLAQDIIDDEVSSMQDSMEPVEVTGALFGGIRGAAGYEDYDWEYLKVWSQIVVL